MPRTVPMSGSDFTRLLTTSVRLPNEIHTTSDHKRCFVQDNHVGPVWHGSVASEAAMIALNTSSDRGCFPMDSCFRSDTSSVWLCMTNRGTSAGDWRNTNTGAAAASAVASRVNLAAVVSLADATDDNVAFDTEILDTDGCWSAGDPAKLTSKSDGFYGFGATILFAANATGFRRVRILKNSTELLASMTVPAVATGGERTDITLAAEDILAENDYIEVFCYQNSGGALNLAVGSSFWFTKRGSVTIVEPEPPVENDDLLVNQVFDAIIAGDNIEQDILINQIFN